MKNKNDYDSMIDGEDLYPGQVYFMKEGGTGKTLLAKKVDGIPTKITKQYIKYVKYDDEIEQMKMYKLDIATGKIQLIKMEFDNVEETE